MVPNQHHLLYSNWVTKGQKISEWIYEVIVSPKIGKNEEFLPCVVMAEILTIFCPYFGKKDARFSYCYPLLGLKGLDFKPIFLEEYNNCHKPC